MEKDFNPFYHTEDDLVANCEMDYCTEAIKVSLGVLVQADNLVTAVEEIDKMTSVELFPNPFQDNIKISISSAIGNDVNIDIYSLEGKLIKNQQFKIGDEFNESLTWDGKNESGQTISKGIYFLIASFDDRTIKKKIIKF